MQRQYIEPFCGSAAMLLSSPKPAQFEVISDLNYYVANFWRAVKCQPSAVVDVIDYPVVHVDLTARHAWLTDPERTKQLRDNLLDAEWPGDATIAGWWCWGQCAWIGSGWCTKPVTARSDDDVGVSAQIAFVSAIGQGVLTASESAEAKAVVSDARIWPQAHAWIHRLSRRLAAVRVQNASWDRVLNTTASRDSGSTAFFLDPPYRKFEKLYANKTPIADDVCAWACDNAQYRIALCGHLGDYDLPGWEVLTWSRANSTFGGQHTRDEEAIWFSPACDRPRKRKH